MAKVVPNEHAPKEKVHFTFVGTLGPVEFDLGGNGKQSYETDDRAVVDNALVHPWLTVEFDKAASVEVKQRSTIIDPTKDVLSAVGPHANDAFDTEKVRKAEEAKGQADVRLVGIDAGKDQQKKVEEAGVAETVAAAEAKS